MPTPVAFINATQLLIRLGNGASPEVFTHPCMINAARGIDFSSSPTESLVPFCPPDEDLPGWIDREIDSLTATITGAGIFHKASHDNFRDWFLSGLPKNIHVELEGQGYYSGAAVLSTFSITGPGRREKVGFDCTILSDGAWTWQDAT